MASTVTRWSAAFVLLLAAAWAQDASAQDQPAPDKQASADAPSKSDQTPAQPDAPKEGVPKEEVRVLQPQDVAAELLRLKSKADIKAEVTIVPLHGRAVVVKGIIRNGKLIEWFDKRRFISLKNIDKNASGVRLWWVNNTAGWIFLRYAQIQTIALTGKLTAEERRKIMEALKARKNKDGDKPKTADGALPEPELEKLSPRELEAYLLSHYPAEGGWTQAKLRELKRKQIIENQTLGREEAIFVQYFHALIKGRLRELKRSKRKVEFEPGSETKSRSEPGRSGDDAPESDDREE
jgi:hypothetical protein